MPPRRATIIPAQHYDHARIGRELASAQQPWHWRIFKAFLLLYDMPAEMAINTFAATFRHLRADYRHFQTISHALASTARMLLPCRQDAR